MPLYMTKAQRDELVRLYPRAEALLSHMNIVEPTAADMKDTVLMCLRADSTEGAQLPGSELRSCAECKQSVLMAPTSLPLADLGAVVKCQMCFKRTVDSRN